jgi:flagellar biosynthesis protein FlhA
MAAGRVIHTFGQFVVGGSYVVGFVVFAIFVLINFVVITKGATRIGEVTARFTLDAMPGKQMAIDADLNAGLITEAEARQRRERIAREAEFYGAMDGATKFVRGDAIAGIVIVLINITGGIIIGVLQNGMPFGEALKTYTILTIGDGLVAQIPALIISSAAGIIVTQSAADKSVGSQLSEQLSFQPMALLTGGASCHLGCCRHAAFRLSHQATIMGGVGLGEVSGSRRERRGGRPQPTEEVSAEALLPMTYPVRWVRLIPLGGHLQVGELLS